MKIKMVSLYNNNKKKSSIFFYNTMPNNVITSHFTRE